MSAQAIYSDGWLVTTTGTPFVPTGVRIVDLCEELTVYLNEQVLSTPCATRSYYQDVDAEDLAGPIVLVRPAPEAFGQENEGVGGSVQSDYVLAVALLDRAENDAAVDLALDTLQDIEEATRAKTLSGFCRIGAECPISYDVDALREKRLFRGLLRLTWRGIEG